MTPVQQPTPQQQPSQMLHHANSIPNLHQQPQLSPQNRGQKRTYSSSCSSYGSSDDHLPSPINVNHINYQQNYSHLIESPPVSTSSLDNGNVFPNRPYSNDSYDNHLHDYSHAHQRNLDHLEQPTFASVIVECDRASQIYQSGIHNLPSHDQLSSPLTPLSQHDRDYSQRHSLGVHQNNLANHTYLKAL